MTFKDRYRLTNICLRCYNPNGPSNRSANRTEPSRIPRFRGSLLVFFRRPFWGTALIYSSCFQSALRDPRDPNYSKKGSLAFPKRDPYHLQNWVPGDLIRDPHYSQKGIPRDLVHLQKGIPRVPIYIYKTGSLGTLGIPIIPDKRSLGIPSISKEGSLGTLGIAIIPDKGSLAFPKRDPQGP